MVLFEIVSCLPTVIV
uniref:Uncharacterized protein n=1 Tax=Arundo donax TaxID=35708 RepID=A0A0A9BPB1_ARUDO